MKKLVLAMMVAGLFGCASFPDDYKKTDNVTDVTGGLTDSWSATPSITYIQSHTGTVIRRYAEIDRAVGGKQIQLSFNNQRSVTLGDVIFALRANGVKIVSRLTPESSKALWGDSEFNGTLENLMRDITETYNLGMEFRKGVVYIQENNRYLASMPQHEEFLAQVEKAVTSMGGTDVRADVQAGQLHYFAKPDVAEHVEEYLELVAKNSAMVTLQVAVLTVDMTRDVNIGFDWTKFMVQAGSGGLSPGSQTVTPGGSEVPPAAGAAGAVVGGIVGGAVAGPIGGVVGGAVGDAVGGAGAAATKVPLGSLVSAGGEGLNVKYVSKAFSLSAALRALSTYGNARTEQNVVLGTLSGVPIKIKSGKKIPYVKSIGATTASGGSIQGSSDTDTVESGLTVDVTPNFDANDRTVVTKIKVELSSLVAMRELSAGVNLGTLSQPEMQTLDFENVGRIQAGETIVVGGVTFDQMSNSFTNLPGLEQLPTGSKATKMSRNTIYIVVRPTVVLFTPNPPKIAPVGVVAFEQAATTVVMPTQVVVHPAPKVITGDAIQRAKSAAELKELFNE